MKKHVTEAIGYDLPSKNSKRACGFGIGNRFRTPNHDRNGSSKFSIIPQNCYLVSPEPGTYNLKSEFEVGRPGTCNTVTKAGIYSFGIGREKFEKVYMSSRKSVALTPGPGTYTSSLYSVGTEGRKFAF